MLNVNVIDGGGWGGGGGEGNDFTVKGRKIKLLNENLSLTYKKSMTICHHSWEV